jgi:hypothetical protein
MLPAESDSRLMLLKLPGGRDLCLIESRPEVLEPRIEIVAKQLLHATPRWFLQKIRAEPCIPDTVRFAYDERVALVVSARSQRKRERQQ